MNLKTKDRLNNPFSSLKYRNFRLFWIGMCVSLIGTWMQNIAQPWLAYSLSGSPLLLSLVGTLQFTPVLLFSLFAGVIIDRFPKKKILLYTQTASLLITLVLSILVFSGNIRFWHILVMSAMLGTVNAFDMPARQAFVIDLVEKDSLMNAIALNSMAFNLARIIGPTIAGIVMGTLGVASCFLINAISFGTVIVSLFFINPVVCGIKKEKNKAVLSDIIDGLRYIRSRKVLLGTLLAVAVVGTFTPNFNVLVPVFTKEVLKMNETYFGLIMSIMGVGSFLGAMFIASFSRTGPRKFMIFVVPFVIGTFLTLTGYTNNYLTTGLFLAITGFFFILFSSSANSTVQINSEDNYRGRVMSVYTLVFAGSTPIGNLFAGFFADRFNSRIGFAACGFAVLILMIPLVVVLGRRSHEEEELEA